jgi:hypothetical protein
MTTAYLISLADGNSVKVEADQVSIDDVCLILNREGEVRFMVYNGHWTTVRAVEAPAPEDSSE